MSKSAKNVPTQVVRRRGWAKPVSTDATGLTERALKRAGFPDPSLVFRWSEIAGPETAKVAHPVRCRQEAAGMVLTLKCESGATVFLQHETRALIGRLNAYLGSGTISRIRVITGTLAPVRDVTAHPMPKRAPQGQQSAGKGLENALDCLENLRDALPRKGPT